MAPCCRKKHQQLVIREAFVPVLEAQIPGQDPEQCGGWQQIARILLLLRLTKAQSWSASPGRWLQALDGHRVIANCLEHARPLGHGSV